MDLISKPDLQGRPGLISPLWAYDCERDMSGMLGSNEESFTCINHLIEEKKGDKDDEGYQIEKHY